MYLTKLNTNNGLKRSLDFDNLDSRHKFVYGLFPYRENGVRILARVNDDHILIQSPIYPDLRRLEDYDFAIKKFSRSFEYGEVLRFDTIVNPARKALTAKNRQPIRDATERKEWFCSLASKSGFELLDCEEYSHDVRIITKTDKNTVTINESRFCGILKIIDAEKFNCSFLAGIGPSKWAGYGMLCLAPV